MPRGDETTQKSDEMWRRVDAQWYRRVYPLVDDILARCPGIRPFDVYGAVGSILGHSPNPWFCES